MKRLLGLAALAGIGALAYQAMKKRQRDDSMQTQPSAPMPKVRDAGPGAMREEPPRWGRTDQRLDESFPASDPPGTY